MTRYNLLWNIKLQILVYIFGEQGGLQSSSHRFRHMN